MVILIKMSGALQILSRLLSFSSDISLRHEEHVCCATEFSTAAHKPSNLLNNGIKHHSPFFSTEKEVHSDTTIVRMLVGNKCDLEDIRDVSVEKGTSLAEAEGLFFIETSALDSTNVKTALEIVVREIYNNVSRKTLNSDSYKAAFL